MDSLGVQKLEEKIKKLVESSWEEAEDSLYFIRDYSTSWDDDSSGWIMDGPPDIPAIVFDDEDDAQWAASIIDELPSEMCENDVEIKMRYETMETEGGKFEVTPFWDICV